MYFLKRSATQLLLMTAHIRSLDLLRFYMTWLKTTAANKKTVVTLLEVDSKVKEVGQENWFILFPPFGLLVNWII